MQYMLLIYSDEKAGADMSAEAMDAMMGEYNAYTEALEKSGLMRAGDALDQCVSFARALHILPARHRN